MLIIYELIFLKWIDFLKRTLAAGDARTEQIGFGK